jgi:mRNA interferase RelE/StbE
MSSKSSIYDIQFKSTTAKEFRNLPLDIKKRIIDKIDSLASNPLPKGVKNLKGKNDYYRLRVGVYQIVYELLLTKNMIIVTRIRHRKDVYQ